MPDCELSLERDQQTMPHFDSISTFCIIEVINFDTLYLVASNKNINEVVAINKYLRLVNTEQTLDCVRVITDIFESLKLRIEFPTPFRIVDNINTFLVMEKF